MTVFMVQDLKPGHIWDQLEPTDNQTSADSTVRILSGFTVRVLSVKIKKFQSGGFSNVRISNLNLFLADFDRQTPNGGSGQNPDSAVRRRLLGARGDFTSF